MRPMEVSTVRALNALNRRFYAAIADEWQASREHPWPGFERVVQAAVATGHDKLRVLDVGAGDARFAEYLTARCTMPFEYVGIDASRELIARAQNRKLSPSCTLQHADFVEQADWLSALQLRPQSLAALFGVMHHVPSLALRKQLLATVASALAPRGLLAITFWRLHQDERFAKRVVSWEDYNYRAARPIAESELEPGDTLLTWSDGDAPPRYCHFADDAEIEELAASTGLRTLERFRSDGRGGQLNEYLILQRPSDAG
jgi:SAM-dependent methyltransferase